MSDTPPPDATQCLRDFRAGDPAAAERLMHLVYDELRRLARSYFRNQPKNHTLEPTALVHEAFVRMVDQTGVEWRDRSHFVGVCAVAMRGILTDHARRRMTAKRGGDWKRLALSGVATPPGSTQIDLLALDEALSELAALNERQARIVEYRYFGGMTIPEVAETLGVSKTTVDEDWRMARAWLSVRLDGDT